MCSSDLTRLATSTTRRDAGDVAWGAGRGARGGGVRGAARLQERRLQLLLGGHLVGGALVDDVQLLGALLLLEAPLVHRAQLALELGAPGGRGRMGVVEGRSGARVVLWDETGTFGGALRSQPQTIDSRPAMDWVRDTATELGRLENVTVLNRTTAPAYYDHNMVVLAERVADHNTAPEKHEPHPRPLPVLSPRARPTTGAR